MMPSEPEDPPEARATIEALTRGLRAESAPAGFTERVIRRCALAKAERNGALPRPEPSPRYRFAASPRTAAIAAAAVWAIAFLLGIPESARRDDRFLASAVVRRTGGSDPRAGWVKIDMLKELAAANLIDGALATGMKQGYRYEAFWDGENPFHWWVIASPVHPGAGDRYFYVDESGTIRFEVGKIPTERSRAIGG